jgi:hypothetical protein
MQSWSAHPVEFTRLLVPSGIRSDIISSTISTDGSDGDITIETSLGWYQDWVEFSVRFGVGVGRLLLEKHAVILHILMFSNSSRPVIVELTEGC